MRLPPLFRTVGARILVSTVSPIALTAVAFVALRAAFAGIATDPVGPALVIALVLGGISALVAALLAAGTITRPLERLRDRVSARATSSAGWTLDGPPEVERLALALRHAATEAAGREADLLLTAQDLGTLRRLESVRRDFVANVSHELRTPIASLKAMAETLAGGALDDRVAAQDFVERMGREIDELAHLVAELLTLARVESGAEEMHLASTRPADLMATAASRLRPLAERAGVAFDVEAATDLPAVQADADRIGQVLANLVHNAVKFTPEGGRVSLGAELADGAVRFVVRDNGEGIERADLDRVFERFYKGERSRSGGGTGLGLAIARHIVEAHGGTVSATSEGPGRGSTFTFTVPRA